MMSPTVNPNPAVEDDASIGSLLRGNELPRLERTLLLAHILGKTRESVLAHPEIRLSEDAAGEFSRLVGRRLKGEPMAYLLGKREFYGLSLHVTPAVLIPRPDTEILVDAALRRLGDGLPGRLLDLGTGSGAVAIAIAAHRPRVRVDALDVEPAAVALAAANAGALGIPNVHVRQSDWYSGCSGEPYDVIVSNPPYIPSMDPHLSEGDLRFEPRVALTPGEDGLEAIRCIVAGARSRLVPGGWLMFEHGYDQADRCRHLMVEAGFVEIASLRDLAGIERVCEGKSPGARLR